MTHILGLYSPYPQSGKSTLAQALGALQPHNVVHLKFADAMRDVIVPFVAPFLDGGDTEARAWLDDERKDTRPVPHLNVTMRHMLQTLGTQWGRHLIHPDMWVILARERIRRIQAMARWRPALVIVDDVRFENEHAMLRKEGAVLIRIDRPDRPATAQHESNARLEGLPFDYDISNDGTPKDLSRKAWAIGVQLGLDSEIGRYLKEAA